MDGFEGFTPAQREAVLADDGPLAILAGPGSGKTTVLAGRIAYLVRGRSVPPTSILALTFTTAAAEALRQRLAGVLGEAAQRVDITTFHALGLRVLRHWSDRLGLGPYPPAVYAAEDARAVLREAAAAFGLELQPEGAGQARDPWALSVARLASALERFRLHAVETDAPTEAIDGLEPDLLRPLAEAYEQLLQRRGAVDYAAMLTLPLQLLRTEPAALRLLQDSYRVVLVDEYQDTCRVQDALLRQLVARHRNLAVVGDARQLLFRFRGADPRLLLEFEQAYPDARVVRLDQNHRSTGVIVAVSNAIAAPLPSHTPCHTRNAPGPRARIYAAADEADEGRFVAGEIRRLLSTDHLEHAGQVAVLFRTNAQARTLADALRTAGLPVRARAGADLFTRRAVRDAVAYLRLVHCPTDGPALARIINTPPRRLAPIEQALRRKPVPVSELPAWAHKRGGPPARRAVEELLGLLEALHVDAAGRLPAEALGLVLERTGYAAWARAQEDAPARQQSLEALQSLLEASAAPDLGTWLADLHLAEMDGLADRPSAAVTLTTLHLAKGQEWPVVFLVGVEEGLMPYGRSRPDEEDEDERRLAFVGVSRPQVLLYLTYCRTRRLLIEGTESGPEPRQPSRYLRSLPPELVERAA